MHCINWISIIFLIGIWQRVWHYLISAASRPGWRKISRWCHCWCRIVLMTDIRLLSFFSRFGSQRILRVIISMVVRWRSAWNNIIVIVVWSFAIPYIGIWHSSGCCIEVLVFILSSHWWFLQLFFSIKASFLVVENTPFYRVWIILLVAAGDFFLKIRRLKVVMTFESFVLNLSVALFFVSTFSPFILNILRANERASPPFFNHALADLVCVSTCHLVEEVKAILMFHVKCHVTSTNTSSDFFLLFFLFYVLSWYGLLVWFWCLHCWHYWHSKHWISSKPLHGCSWATTTSTTRRRRWSSCLKRISSLPSSSCTFLYDWFLASSCETVYKIRSKKFFFD